MAATDMELEPIKAVFIDGIIAIETTDPPKLAERVGNPLVTVDPPTAQSVAYGIVRGADWEIGSGVLHTKHGPKRTDGTRLVIESVARGTVLRSSVEGDLRLKFTNEEEVALYIDAANEPLPVKIERLIKSVQGIKGQ